QQFFLLELKSLNILVLIKQ
ncbi:unnamed protein product, partial [Adineta steineri]